METTALIKVVNSVLPVLANAGLMYNKENNIFLTTGYTSAAGNTYFNGIRLSDRILIDFSFGQGYFYTFLNGITVYGYNGNGRRIIGTRFYHGNVFSEERAKRAVIEIVSDFIRGEMKMIGEVINDTDVNEFATALVDHTYSTMKLIA